MNISFLRGLVSLSLLVFAVGACGGSSGGGGDDEDDWNWRKGCAEIMQECQGRGICTDEFSALAECMDSCDQFDPGGDHSYYWGDHFNNGSDWYACYDSYCGTEHREAETCFEYQCMNGRWGCIELAHAGAP